MQWRRPVPVGGETQYVKLDLLVGPIGSHQSSLKVNGPRARPKGTFNSTPGGPTRP